LLKVQGVAAQWAASQEGLNSASKQVIIYFFFYQFIVKFTAVIDLKGNTVNNMKAEKGIVTQEIVSIFGNRKFIAGFKKVHQWLPHFVLTMHSQMAVRLSALRAGCPLPPPPPKDSWYSFLLKG
jgi:hypothetical protein